MSKLIIKNKYATIPNSLLNNDKISLKAKGLFAYIQGKPENWEFSKERIAKQLKEGLTSIKSAFKELKENGYLETIPSKDKKGKFNGYDYLLNDNPKDGLTAGYKTDPAENHTAISNIEISKKEFSKKENIAKTSFASNSNPELIEKEEIKEEVFDFPLVIEKMKNDKNKHIQIIAYYWFYKEITFDNKLQYQSAIKRELRPSMLLTGYSIERICETMYWLNGTEIIDWTLETVGKYIMQNLDELTEKGGKFYGGFEEVKK